jgi:hypothetical protein
MRSLSAKEIEAVTSLDAIKRFQYLIKRVADSEKLYSLKSLEGNWAVSTIDNKTLFPIWSATEFAENCATDGWEGFDVTEISLTQFQDNIIDFISDEAFLLNVFPVGRTTGFVVDLDEFVRDLKEELDKY